MNLLFFLTPKQDVLFVYEDFTLRQTLEKWTNQRFATIPVLRRNGEYVGTITEGDILWGIKNLHGLDLDPADVITRPCLSPPICVHCCTPPSTRTLFRWWMTVTSLSAWYAVP